jgi:fatty acid desaturase
MEPNQKEINAVISRLDEKYKGQSKIWTSLAFVFRDAFISYLIYAFCYNNVNYTLYSGLMGTSAFGLWVIGHECGHGAFGDNWLQNDVFGFVIHSALLVPYFSWKYSHNKHHKYTNHLVLGETHVPKTRSEQKYILFRKWLGKDAFAIVLIFVGLLIGWPKYIFYYSVSGRTQTDLTSKLVKGVNKSHFTSASQVMKPSWKIELSTLGCLTTIGLLVYYNLVHAYFGPYLVVNAWLVLYTWLHHTHPDVPHYGPEDFTFLKGALSTVDRPYPWLIDQMHHHIGTTHVLHHVNSSIPHYRAEEYTREIKKVLGPAYLFDNTPIWKAAFITARKCVYVEGLTGTQYYKD